MQRIQLKWGYYLVYTHMIFPRVPKYIQFLIEDREGRTLNLKLTVLVSNESVFWLTIDKKIARFFDSFI